MSKNKTHMVLNYKGVEYKSGDVIIATIKGDLVIGKIHIEDKLSSFGNTHVTRNYICHNNSGFNGSGEPRYGFTYSWAFYESDNDGNTAISLSDEVILISKSKADFNFRKIKIGSRLVDFMCNQNTPSTYLEMDNVFAEYDTFDISDKSGMVKLTGNSKKFGIINGRKSIELKMGRFLNTYVNFVKDALDHDLEYTKNNIEKIHNNYLSFQNGSHVSIDIVDGDEILDGYKRENYSKSKSSLGGSCMTDQLGLLELYSRNQNNIQMLVIKMFDKVAGRALLWKTNSGKILMEKTYICDEWVGSKFNSICEENNYTKFSDGINMEVDVNIKDIEKWPYLDTFYYMVKNKTEDKARLFNYPPSGKSITLRTTCGEYGYYDNNGPDLIIE